MSKELINFQLPKEYALEITQDAKIQRDAILAQALGIGSITNEEENNAAQLTIADIRKMRKALESSRKEVKAPILEIGKRIDSLAQDFAETLDLEDARLTKVLGEYLVLKKKEADALAEEARKTQELEQKKIQEELAKLEAAKAQTKSQDDFVVAQRELEEKKRTALLAQEEANKKQKAIAESANIKVKGAGTSFKEVWKYEVRDINVLFTNRPELCKVEANPCAIRSLVDQGIRELPGVTIWSENIVNVRS